MTRHKGYQEMKDDHIHNPACKGGSHRAGPRGLPETYPGTALQREPKKWTWRDYKAAAIKRRRTEA